MGAFSEPEPHAAVGPALLVETGCEREGRAVVGGVQRDNLEGGVGGGGVR